MEFAFTSRAAINQGTRFRQRHDTPLTVAVPNYIFSHSEPHVNASHDYPTSSNERPARRWSTSTVIGISRSTSLCQTATLRGSRSAWVADGRADEIAVGRDTGCSRRPGLVLAATGCRISEALGACWGDIERDDEGIALRIRKAKTDAGLRSVALSAETVRRLTRRRAESPYAADSDPIFPSRNGRTPIVPNNWRKRVFKPAAERAGVPWATPHKLRHGLASLMANQGYSAAQIAAHLGHADCGVLALRTYVHPNRLDAEFVDEAFGEKSDPDVDRRVDLPAAQSANP